MDDRRIQIQKSLAHAKQADERAEKALDPRAKQNWLEAAERWRELARDIERKKQNQ